MKKNILFAATMLFAGAASAQSNDSGVYVGIEGAYASISGISTVSGYRKTSETNDTGALRALVGYQFNKNLALELGYFATDDFKQSATNGSVSYDTKLKVEGADLSVIYKFTEGVPGLFLKAGATQSRVKGAITARSGSAVASANGSDNGSGYLFGLGYEFSFSQSLGARVAYTRYENLGGQSSDDLNLFSLGLKYKF